MMSRCQMSCFWSFFFARWIDNKKMGAHLPLQYLWLSPSTGLHTDSNLIRWNSADKFVPSHREHLGRNFASFGMTFQPHRTPLDSVKFAHFLETGLFLLHSDHQCGPSSKHEISLVLVRFAFVGWRSPATDQWLAPLYGKQWMMEPMNQLIKHNSWYPCVIEYDSWIF